MTCKKLLWKPWDEGNFQHPYPMYNLLRQEDPIHQAQTGEWIITRYDDVRSILKDPRFVVGNRLDWVKRGIQYLNNKDTDFQAILDAMNSFLLFLNPPQHTRVRKFITTQWNDYALEELIEENINELILQLPTRNFDVVTDFAQQLPALTMTRILGIPTTDYKILKAYARALIKALDLYISVKDLVTVHQASHDFIRYFSVLVREQQFSPDGLLAKIIRENKKQTEPLKDNELISICIFLFTAGEETTSSLIGTGALNLLRHADQLNDLHQTPHQWDLAIDELLRFDPPVQLLGRIASEDIDFQGNIIRKGNTTTLCLGGANRDPSVFASADTLLLTRQQNRHLAFGSGIHFCLGDWLGKLQGKLALKKLIDRYPQLKLSEGELQWNKNLAIRSLSSLPVTV